MSTTGAGHTQDGAAPAGSEVADEGELTQVPSRGARLALERGFWSSQGPRASALSGSSSPWPAPPAGSRAPLLKEKEFGNQRAPSAAPHGLWA